MFEGVSTALITPFKNDKVDEAALRNLVELQIAAGIAGLVPCGSTGESATLSVEEHHRVIDVVIEGRRVREDYEPIAAGYATARVETIVQQVTDGHLDIEFVPVIGDAVVSAIEVTRTN